MNIKSITVLQSTKGYLAVTNNDIFVPEYIVLAVVEDNDKTSLMPLAIRDLITLNEVKDGKEFGKIPNKAVTNTLIEGISLHTAATYIAMQQSQYYQEVEEAKADLQQMAKEANVKYDERIAEIHSFEDCQKIASRTFRKL